MHQIYLRWTGIAVSLWFFGWIVGLAAVRPDYHHATKAISELGALGAPNMQWMNLFGFIGTGLLLAIFARQVKQLPPEVAPSHRWLTACAALFACNAIPLQMNAAGDPDLRALSSQLHFLFVMLTPLPWLIALSGFVSRSPSRLLIWLSWACMIGFSVFALAGFFRLIPNFPGLLQRLAFFFFLCWFAGAGWLLAGHASGLRHKTPRDSEPVRG